MISTLYIFSRRALLTLTLMSWKCPLWLSSNNFSFLPFIFSSIVHMPLVYFSFFLLPPSLSPSLPFFLPSFLCWDWTQDLTRVKHALCHWATPPAHGTNFCVWCEVGIKSDFFPTIYIHLLCITNGNYFLYPMLCTITYGMIIYDFPLSFC